MKKKHNFPGIPAAAKTLLVCEGGWDVAFVKAVCAHMGLAEIFVIAVGGKDMFRQIHVRDIVMIPQFEDLQSFGVILDANGGKDGAKRTLAQINEVTRACMGAPPRFLKHGDVKPLKSGEFAGMSLGAFVMPDGKAPGEMEDLLLQSVEKSHPKVMECVDEFLKCARPKPDAATDKESKKAVQAFLAGLPEHCPDLNAALKENRIQLNDSAFTDLRAFLQKLAEAKRQ